MYQLIAIGDITIDQYFKGESLTQEGDRFSLVIGGKYYSDFFHLSLGGSGANVAIHGAYLGLDTAVVAKVGETTFKNVVVQNLIKKTVSTEFLSFDKDHISISTILLAANGERTIIKHSDPKKNIDINETAIEHIKQCPLIFVGNMPDITVDIRHALIKKIKTPENRVAINFGSKDCQKGLKALRQLINDVDTLFLNRYELGDLLEKDGKKLDLTKNQLKELGVEKTLLVVTDSKGGSYAYTEDEVFHQEAVSVPKILDATGAGDSFTAAFLYKYSQLKNIQESLAYASEYASQILTKIGAN
ncbi:carbohydrate kinase family protein [Candidatus Woesebacteria bacterium]|nr:carbohydrate kinase family protein [Candidatus Woesebacteria bacterium]